MLARLRCHRLNLHSFGYVRSNLVRFSSDNATGGETAHNSAIAKAKKSFSRPKVSKKSGRIWRTKDGELKVKELSQLLKVIENEERAKSTKMQTIERTDQEEAVEIMNERQTNEEVAESGEKYRHHIKENNWKKLRMERKLSCHFLRSTLRSYIHACVNSGALETAEHSLIWYRNKFWRFRSVKDDPPVDVSLYNAVIKGWAYAGKTSKIQDLFKLMKVAKVAPDIQSYALFILSVKKHHGPKPLTVKQILKSMRQRNLNPEDLLTESYLDKDARDLITCAVEEADSSIKLKKPTFLENYDCKIMNGFETLPRTPYLPLDKELNESSGWLEEQKTNEINGFVKIKSVYKNEENDLTKVEDFKKKWTDCENHWRKTFSNAFDRNVKLLKNKFALHYGMNIVPFLTAVKKEVYVNAMLNEMHYLGRISDSYSPPVKVLYADLARKIMNRYITEMYLKQAQETLVVYEDYLKHYYSDEESISTTIPRNYILNTASQHNFNLQDDIDEMRWSYPILLAVGKFLYDIIMTETVIDVNIMRDNPKKSLFNPVFYNVYVSGACRTQEQVRTHPTFTKLYKAANMDDLYFDTTMLPMVVPPLPWTSHKSGGYLMAKTEFIRETGNDEGTLGIKLVSGSNTNVVCDALNVLGLCPWKVNNRILDIMISIFQNKGDTKLDIPLHQSVMPEVPKLNQLKARVDKLAAIQQRNRIKQKRAEMYSLWCDCLYKLSIANHYRNRIFWFPQNLDFRGRVYPTPPHFNHLGNDVARGLLLFAKGKPLGPNGLNWLKLHLVNLTGLKKRSPINERLEFADEIMPEILDSADYPLTGNQWWKSSEEPWQTLATCFEIAKAIRSENVEKHICHFPVHQDGSCNGLQHYAALGRDEEGALSVNLQPDDKPNDVYSTVASRVEQERQKDAEQGQQIARVLEGFITRKVVKQTVMTYVYGVTRYGARLQILKQLKDLDTFPQEQTWVASSYVAGKTFLSIQSMFTATRLIQDWFTTCAGSISKVLGVPVQWITPLGFPVIQPYFKQASFNPQTTNSEIMSVRSEGSWKPNVMKQKNAYPPNFIHSLDSSHMMLTALHCERLGMTFQAVHDSYWTHPSCVELMNKLCREQFISLHSQPILDDLSRFMIEKYEPILRHRFAVTDPEYQNHLSLFKAVPERGKFKLSNVNDSVYFFS